MQNELNIQVIQDAVKQAGDLFIGDFKKRPVPQDKSEFLALLGEIEEKCLASLKKSLSDCFPETPWLGEEFDRNEQKNPLSYAEYWLCDTMDGAIQYLQHIPGWTINLVLVRAGRPFFAVIYDPMQQEMFWAQEGAGAYLNSQLIKPSKKGDSAVMLAVFNHSSAPSEVSGLNQKTGNSVTELLNHFDALRNYGPHGLQLAYVGAGRIDVFYQEGLDTYNWLPGILIAKEAGAEILTSDGRAWTWGEESLLASSPGVAERIIKNKVNNPDLLI